MDVEEKITVLPGRPSRRPSAVVIPRKTWLLVRVVAIVASVLIVLLAIALAVVVTIKTTPPYCSEDLGHSGRDLKRPGIFNDLTPTEMVNVRDYMMSQERLGLTPYEEAVINSSYIYMMTLVVPLKSSVLKYQLGQDRKPQRAAKVIVFRGNTYPPKVEEYLVGPLPKPDYYRAVTSPNYRRVPIPFSSRPVDAVERAELKTFLSFVTEELHQLFKESYGLTYNNCTPKVDCLILEDYAPRGTESGERMSWFWAYRDTEGYYLHPLGFAIQVDHLSVNPIEWTVSRVIYNGQLFYEIEDLMERYAENSLRKIKPIMDDVDAQFSSFQKRGHYTFDTPLRGPRLIEPDGHRYSVKDQFVKYFGWSFNFHMRTDLGLQIVDVYFQGERIAYEISLQDITAFYTGYSPETAWLGLYGVSWLLGASSYELVAGVDCSAAASFFDTYHYVNTGVPLLYKNSICIFEQTSGIPLRRHHSKKRDGKFDSYGGLVSSSLVVRTAISLWSADYIVDYIFHLDGTIELKISLTGYIQASYDLAGQSPYGNRLHETARGNLHQHLFHWKVDLDIESTDNRYQTLDFTTEAGPSFWYENTVNNTKLKFENSIKLDERSAKVPFNFSRPQHHIIYNNRAYNKYGANRAYRVINEAMSKFLLENSTVTKAASWARYQMAVTKYKDTEDSSSSIYAQGDPYNPVVDFSRFLEDNDTIVDTDLILWITSGVYQIPHAEEVPSTTTTTNQCRIFLTPYNFFNHCPSMAVSDALSIRSKESDKHSEGEKSELVFETFGTESGEPKCYQKEHSVKMFNGDIEQMS
ncbi:amine oxidase [Plakobranchus ocellatus]|uniref:Amine oxidase n=1 Tax=Plakobranchus ocellatus TaxID=259542 RepID=A0AAV4E221_9GAST|nr:amine oxidase [Plakobranchus ocellatus]